MIKLIIFLSIIVLFGPVTSTCPNRSYPLPSFLGSNWPCILLDGDRNTFASAEANCEIYNGRLISIPNGFVNDIVADLTSSAHLPYNVWIGISRSRGGIWKNVDDGKNTTYFNWMKGQPYECTDCNCININPGGHWYTDRCDDGLFYVCGIPETGETESTSF